MYCLGSYRKQQVTKNVSNLMNYKTHSAFQRLNHVYNRVGNSPTIGSHIQPFSDDWCLFFCLIVDKINKLKNNSL